MIYMKFYILAIALWTIYLGYKTYFESGDPLRSEVTGKAIKPYWFEFLAMNILFMPIFLAMSFSNGFLRDDLTWLTESR